MPSRKHIKSRKHSKKKGKKCSAGKVRNPLTGRCIKIKTLQAYLKKLKSKSKSHKYYKRHKSHKKYSRHHKKYGPGFKTFMDGKVGKISVSDITYVPPGFVPTGGW